MPRIGRWCRISDDINSDPEVWEMRNTLGDRTLGIWIEFIAIGNRNGGSLEALAGGSDTLSLPSAKALAFKCHTSADKVRQVWDMAAAKGWIACDPTPRIRNYPYGNSSWESKESRPGKIKSQTREEKSRQEKSRDKEPPPVAEVLPDWLPKEIWEDFKAHRKNKRSPVTPTIAKRIFETLDQLRGSGYPPTFVLNQSIVNGWTGIFEPKGNGAAPKPQAEGELSDRTMRILRRGL